jgi:hypothetical protein
LQVFTTTNSNPILFDPDVFNGNPIKTVLTNGNAPQKFAYGGDVIVMSFDYSYFVASFDKEKR